MIPAMNIIAWANVAPWAEQRQIEQDLLISRAIVELFAPAEGGLNNHDSRPPGLYQS